MWRRPVEDEEEEHDRRQSDIAGHRGPADDRGQRTSGTANDDVLGRAALEHDRIDEHVEGDREQGQDDDERKRHRSLRDFRFVDRRRCLDRLEVAALAAQFFDEVAREQFVECLVRIELGDLADLDDVADFHRSVDEIEDRFLVG